MGKFLSLSHGAQIRRADANLGEAGARPLYIKLAARPDGSFTVLNSRNGFTKQYGPR